LNSNDDMSTDNDLTKLDDGAFIGEISRVVTGSIALRAEIQVARMLKRPLSTSAVATEVGHRMAVGSNRDRLRELFLNHGELTELELQLPDGSEVTIDAFSGFSSGDRYQDICATHLLRACSAILHKRFTATLKKPGSVASPPLSSPKQVVASAPSRPAPEKKSQSWTRDHKIALIIGIITIGSGFVYFAWDHVGGVAKPSQPMATINQSPTIVIQNYGQSISQALATAGQSPPTRPPQSATSQTSSSPPK
jgi:hypothetical protein